MAGYPPNHRLPKRQDLTAEQLELSALAQMEQGVLRTAPSFRYSKEERRARVSNGVVVASEIPFFAVTCPEEVTRGVRCAMVGVLQKGVKWGGVVTVHLSRCLRQCLLCVHVCLF